MSFATALASYLGGRNQAKAANADNQYRQQQLAIEQQKAEQEAQDDALNRQLTQQQIAAGARDDAQAQANRDFEKGLKPFPSTYTPEQQIAYLSKRAAAAQAAGDDTVFQQTMTQINAIPRADKDFASATADRQKPLLLHMKLEAASEALTKKYGYGIALEIRKAADAMDRTRYNDTARHDIAVLAAQNAMARVQAQQGGMMSRAIMAQNGANARTAATIQGANSRAITADDVRIATAEYEAQMRADDTVGSPTYGQTPGALPMPSGVADAPVPALPQQTVPPVAIYNYGTGGGQPYVPELKPMDNNNAFTGPNANGQNYGTNNGNANGGNGGNSAPAVDVPTLVASARKALAHGVTMAQILANTPASARAAVQAALAGSARPQPLPPGGFRGVVAPSAAPAQVNPFGQP